MRRGVPGLAVVVLLSIGGVAAGQPVRSGPTFNLGATTSPPAVAHDSVNNRWLQVAGNGIVEAHLLDATGGLLRTFRVNAGSAPAVNPRLCFSRHLGDGAGGYLVTWHATVNGITELQGRMIGADGTPLTDDFPIGGGTGAEGTRSGHFAGVAYSTTSRVFFVAWAANSTRDVFARRIGLTGALLPSAGFAGPYEFGRIGVSFGEPDVAYNPVRDEFFLVYGKPSPGPAGGALVNAAAGTVFEPTFDATSDVTAATITYNTSSGRYLLVWRAGEQFLRQVLEGDGTPAGPIGPLLGVAFAFAEYDIDFNPVSGEFLLVMRGHFLNADAWAIRSNGEVVGSGFFLTDLASTGGNPAANCHWARTAASSLEKKWLAVCLATTSTTDVAAQFVSSNSVPESPDGGGRLLDYTLGARLDGGTHTFRWSPGSLATAYWVNVGRTQGGYELFSNYVAGQTTLTLRNLPLDGGPVWVRLLSRVNGAYVYTDYRFTAATARAAAVFSPAPGGTLTSTTATFEWDAGETVDGFWVNVGATQGGYNFFSNFVGKSRSVTVFGFPLGGSVWVRLGSRINGQYVWNDFQFVGPRPTPAAITAPTPGVQLTSTTHAFHWDAGLGVTAYWLDVGSVQGGAEYWSKYHAQDRYTVVNTLPANGRPLWLRLSSLINGVWTFRDYVYTAPVAAPALLTSHHAGSTMAATTVTFTWSPGVGATAYWLDIGSVRGGYEYYSNYQGTYRSRTVTGLPGNGGQLWLRLWSLINGVWTFVDYPLTAAQ